MIECMIFIILVIFWKDYYVFRKEKYPNNKFFDPNKTEFTTNEIGMLNIIYVNHEGIYRLDFLLAILGFLIWLRFFFCLKVS